MPPHYEMGFPDGTVLFDFATGKRIVCTNSKSASEQMCVQNLSQSPKKGVFLLDVGKPLPCLEALVESTGQTTPAGLEKNNSRPFVDLATFLHCKLGEPEVDTVIVFCEDGLTRTPSVLLAFFILFRGLSIEAGTSWLLESSKLQRPAGAAERGEVPTI